MDATKYNRISYKLDFETRLRHYDFLDSERAFAVFLGHFYNALALYFQDNWHATFSPNAYASAIRFYAIELGKEHSAIDKFVGDFQAAENLFSQFENEYSFIIGLIKGGFWDGVDIAIELKEKCLLYEDIHAQDYFYPLTSLGLSGQSLYDLMRSGKHIFERFSPEKFSQLLEKLKDLVYHDHRSQNKNSHFDFVKSFIALYVLQKAYYQHDFVPVKPKNVLEGCSKSNCDVLIAKQRRKEDPKTPLTGHGYQPNLKIMGMRTATKFTNLKLNRDQSNFTGDIMLSSDEIANAIKLVEHENKSLSHQQGKLLKELETEFQQLRQSSRNFRELFDFVENTQSMIRKMSYLKS